MLMGESNAARLGNAGVTLAAFTAPASASDHTMLQMSERVISDPSWRALPTWGNVGQARHRECNHAHPGRIFSFLYRDEGTVGHHVTFPRTWLRARRLQRAVRGALIPVGEKKLVQRARGLCRARLEAIGCMTDTIITAVLGGL